MKLLSLDLEMNQPSGKIIQVGACVGDTRTGQVLDTLSVFVDPEEELSEYIVTLTGIYPAHIINEGKTLLEAYELLRDFHLKHQCFMNPLTWGGGDSYELRQQLKIQSVEPEDWCFGRRWIDVKTLYITKRIAIEANLQAGLAKAMHREGLQFKGRKHDAKSDAINTFYMFVHLMRKFK